MWEWDLQNVEDDEENRPEFEATAKNFRTNPVTKEKEPYIPTSTKIFRYCVTAGVVFLMVILRLLKKLGNDIWIFTKFTFLFCLSKGVSCVGGCIRNNHLSDISSFSSLWWFRRVSSDTRQNFHNNDCGNYQFNNYHDPNQGKQNIKYRRTVLIK